MLHASHTLSAWRKLLCLSLSFVFLLSICPAPRQAVAHTMPTLSFLASQEANAETARRRLAQYETTTNAVGYQNDDGSCTVVLYADDVRFADQGGRMIEKDLHFVNVPAEEDIRSTHVYRTAANELTPNGQIHLTRLSVSHYGDFSKEGRRTIESSELERALNSMERIASTRSHDGVFEMSSPVLTRLEDGKLVMRAEMRYTVNGNRSDVVPIQSVAFDFAKEDLS